MKILGICSYRGTNYYGWQKQIGFVSVQEKIEETLSKIYDSPISIQGSGRTDAGVHALKQYFHYVTNKEKDLKQLTYALNKMLPDDIKIISLKVVNDDFHARYNATKKIYEYRLLLTNKDPFSYDLAYIYPMELDVPAFIDALNRFVGTHNFQDFTSKEDDEGNFIRTVYDVEIIREKDKSLLRVIFTGNGFMRYQIRNMIGAALSVASGKEKMSFIDKHLKNDKSREIIAYKAPASGLYLVDVIY